jgi:hypothetical protein
MSLFTSALAGAADAGSKVLNKYIDDDILRNRAQVLADIQRTSAVQQEGDIATQRLSRAPQEAQASAATERVVGAARSQVALDAERARVSDKPLNDALLANRQAEADQAHNIKTSQSIADSKNPSLLRALADLENASPHKKAQTDLVNAQADEVRARAGALRSGVGKSGKAEKMDEADKIEYQNLFGEVKSALSNQAKFEAEGMPVDAEGKPTAQYGIVKKNAAAAQRKLLSFQMRKGLLEPEDMAASAIAGEQDSTKIGAAIAQAYELGGGQFGDQFFQAVRKSGALERNAEAAAGKDKPGAKQLPVQPAEKKPSYGLFSAFRDSYLRQQKKQGSITPKEDQELAQLQEAKPNAWWRGRASEANYEE